MFGSVRTFEPPLGVFLSGYGAFQAAKARGELEDGE